ncbi:MAG: FecR domain-containing protein [Candidatus Sericytochromatia bacterium]|nr:FecR domain-containing protein [Candidatus Sericytochromatia bacterium]
MRRTLAVILLIAGFTTGATPPGGARLTYVQGTCQIANADAKWRPMKLGDRAMLGNQVRTGSKSRAELSFADGTIVRLSPDSRLQFKVERAGGPGAYKTLLQAWAGQVWAHVAKNRGQFAIAGTQSVAAVTGTTFRMEVQKEKTATVVYEGSVGIAAEPKEASEVSMALLEKAPQPPAQPAAFGKPTEIGKPYSVVSPPMHAIAGPHTVSRDEWLTIVTNQRIDVDADGQAIVSEVAPGQESQQDWVQWNQGRDAAAGQ